MSFEANQVRLQLHVLAYNLGNFLRRVALPPSVKHWTLTTLREKLVKIGGKVVHHARYVTFQLAEVAVPASAVPSDSGSDSTVRCHRAEGCTNMTGRRRRQSNEGGRGAAGTTTNLGTNRLSGHSECQFCFYSPSVVRQLSILNLHSPGEGWHNGRLGTRRRCRAGVIWEMSDTATCSAIAQSEDEIT